MVCGDFEFCSVVVTVKPARCWSRQELGEWDLSPGEARIGIWRRLISSTLALMLVKSVLGGIRRNGGVAA